jgi:hypothetical protein
MKTTDWMNGGTVDAALDSKAADLEFEGEKLETARRWNDAADMFEVASDVFEMAGNLVMAGVMRKRAGKCRVWAACHASPGELC